MDKIFELIKRHEGLRLKPYRCTSGKLTIGYGRNLEDVGISEKEANLLLASDVGVAEYTVRDRIDCFNCLSGARKAVLVDMCFNMGWPRLSGFKKFLMHLERGNYGLAADEMVDSRWYHQVGERAKKLVAMMESGEWPAA